MAKDKGTVPTASSDEWETVGGSLGEEWDFSRNGPLVGHYIGSSTVETRKVATGQATAHRFALIDDPERIVFVWESADLRSAFSGTDAIALGDKCRIQYLGEREFTAENGEPRRIKQYRVQRAKS